MNPPPVPAEGEVPPRLIVPRAEVYAEGGFGTYFAVWTLEEPFLVSPTEDIEYVSEQEVARRLSAEKQRGLRAVEEAKAEAEKYRALYETLRMPAENLIAKARAEAFEEAAEYCRAMSKRNQGIGQADYYDAFMSAQFRFEMMAQQSRAAKEPS